MAIYLLDSGSATPTSPYTATTITPTSTEWSKAAHSWTDISGLTIAANDTILVHLAHADAIAATTTLLPVVAGVRVICVDKATNLPSTGAVIEITGPSHTLNLLNSATTNLNPLFEGIIFKTGSGQTTNCAISMGGGAVLRNCQLHSLSTGVSTITAASPLVSWENVDVKAGYSGASSIITLGTTSNNFRWRGGSVLSGSGGFSGLISMTLTTCTVSNIDLSNCANGVVIVNSGTSSSGVFRKILMPASWTGNRVNPSGIGACIFDFVGVGPATSSLNYRGTTNGGIVSDGTFIRTGGASESMKFTCTAGTFPHIALSSTDIELQNTVTGSTVTATVEILVDSATPLTSTDMWMTVRYGADSGDPLGASATSQPNSLATGANLTTSSATWFTTGLTNPNKYKIAVPFIPQQAGRVYAAIHTTRQSTAIYVDPSITLS